MLSKLCIGVTLKCTFLSLGWGYMLVHILRTLVGTFLAQCHRSNNLHPVYWTSGWLKSKVRHWAVWLKNNKADTKSICTWLECLRNSDAVFIFNKLCIPVFFQTETYSKTESCPPVRPYTQKQPGQCPSNTHSTMQQVMNSYICMGDERTTEQAHSPTKKRL